MDAIRSQVDDTLHTHKTESETTSTLTSIHTKMRCRNAIHTSSRHFRVFPGNSSVKCSKDSASYFVYSKKIERLSSRGCRLSTGMTSAMAASPPPHIILGSQSQSRHAILREMGYTEFEVVTAGIDESAIRAPEAEDLVVKLAHAKAEAILAKLALNPSTKQMEKGVPVLLITADQVVVHEGVILEKPKSAEEARRVIRGYTRSPAITVGSILVTNLATGVRVGGVDKAEVYFNEIPDEVIEALVEEGCVFYSAGGLLVEHPLVSPLVEAMVGTLDSVMGMSKELLRSLIQQASTPQSNHSDNT